MSFSFALVGNPNCGKTTLFNRLTGSNQYVGNWPGVTVERKAGKIKFHGMNIDVIDLPGIYSLSPYTPEEVIARKYIVNDKPSLIINVIDATNIERNLYLTMQLLEFGRPMVVVLNMMDALQKKGEKIDCSALEKELGVPIVPISASHGTGIHELLHSAVSAAELGAQKHAEHHRKDNESGVSDEFEHNHPHPLPTPHGTYSSAVENAIDSIERIIAKQADVLDISRRFAAVKMFERDPITVEQLHLTKQELDDVNKIVSEVEHIQGLDHETIIADMRYNYVCGLCQRVVDKTKANKGPSVTDRIDSIVTNKYLAIPVFFLIMLAIFMITFGPIGNFLSDKTELLIEMFSDFVENLLINAGAASWAQGLVVEGIIGGIGAIVSFFPQILLLFLFLSILEDSGYMARAAFVMDGLLSKVGLSGRAFVPMLMGFGCSVPAIMATRTLDNEKDKKLTITIIPFMSCGAKMPVYAVIIGAFFQASSGLVVFGIYFIGLLIAILSSILLRKTVFRNERAPFIMELPPYRLPMPRSLLLRTWERIKDFAVRAATILLGSAIVIWFLQNFSFNMQSVAEPADSMLAKIGAFIAPVLKPLGFGTWEVAVALVAGLVAKESIISTLGVIFAAESVTSLTGILQSVFTPLSAFSFLIFVLLYMPCVAAFSAARREMNSTWKALLAAVYQTSIAWICAFLVYNIGILMGLG